MDAQQEGEPPQAWPMPWRLRAQRAVRSRLLLIVATSAIAFAAAALFFVFYYFDPDRVPPNSLLREANRQRVTLIGPTGPPKWSRWNRGEATAMVAPEADEPFSYTSFENGRLELLPGAPQPGFRFEADVRHDRVIDDYGDVGIYLGYVVRQTDDDVKRYWCDITFADRGRLAISSKGPDPQQKYTFELRNENGAILIRQTEGQYDWTPVEQVHVGPQTQYQMPDPEHRTEGDWLQLGNQQELDGKDRKSVV